MCATAWQDVWSGPPPGVPGAGDAEGLALLGAGLAVAFTTVLVTGNCSAPSEMTEPALEAVGARATLPVSPATATTSTAAEPVVAARPTGLSPPRPRTPHPAARARPTARSMAPWRIGSSM